MNPLQRHLAWHVPRKLDLARMREAAACFVGKHNFQSFSSNPGYARRTTVRTLTRCELKKSGPQLTFIIEGDGFLYKMCRGIVGTIVQAGQGKFPPADVKTMLAKSDRRVAGMTAPAHGLVLWKVFYSAPAAPKQWRKAVANWRSSRDPASVRFAAHMNIVWLNLRFRPNTGNVARLCAATKSSCTWSSRSVSNWTMPN